MRLPAPESFTVDLRAPRLHLIFVVDSSLSLSAPEELRPQNNLFLGEHGDHRIGAAMEAIHKFITHVYSRRGFHAGDVFSLCRFASSGRVLARECPLGVVADDPAKLIEVDFKRGEEALFSAAMDRIDSCLQRGATKPRPVGEGVSSGPYIPVVVILSDGNTFAEDIRHSMDRLDQILRQHTGSNSPHFVLVQFMNNDGRSDGRRGRDGVFEAIMERCPDAWHLGIQGHMQELNYYMVTVAEAIVRNAQERGGGKEGRPSPSLPSHSTAPVSPPASHRSSESVYEVGREEYISSMAVKLRRTAENIVGASRDSSLYKSIRRALARGDITKQESQVLEDARVLGNNIIHATKTRNTLFRDRNTTQELKRLQGKLDAIAERMRHRL